MSDQFYRWSRIPLTDSADLQCPIWDTSADFLYGKYGKKCKFGILCVGLVSVIGLAWLGYINFRYPRKQTNDPPEEKQEKEELQESTRRNIQQLQADNERSQLEIAKYKEEKRKIESRIAEVELDRDALEAGKDALLQRIEHLTNQLSAEMSKKIAADESSVENVNIKNRPMNIADDYVHFCSNEWLAAKTVLDEIKDSDEGDKIQLLFHIMMVCEEEMGNLQKCLLGCIAKQLFKSDITQDLGSLGTEASLLEENTNTKVTLPLQVTNVIRDFLRVQADSVKLSDHKVFEKLNEDLNMEEKPSCLHTLWQQGKDLKEVKAYVTSCLSLCWKMVLQRPPMTFKTSDKYLGEKYQDLFWKSADPAESCVSKCQTVYPMVYHGASLMAKGKVYLVKQQPQDTSSPDEKED